MLRDGDLATRYMHGCTMAVYTESPGKHGLSLLTSDPMPNIARNFASRSYDDFKIYQRGTDNNSK